jgi:hypothetical protein
MLRYNITYLKRIKIDFDERRILRSRVLFEIFVKIEMNHSVLDLTSQLLFGCFKLEGKWYPDTLLKAMVGGNFRNKL